MTKIFIVTHEKSPILANDILVPIQVGNRANIETNILRDDTFDTISKKNNTFCELTAAYWIWKNYNDADIVGICHYRRYFNFFNPIYNLKPSAQKKISVSKFKQTKAFKSSSSILDKKITSILSTHDIILVRPYEFKKGSLSQNYCDEHRHEDWELTKKIIKEKYPQYTESIKLFLDEGTKFHIGNMLICTKKLFDDYHEWLFSILFELESKVTIPDDPYQARLFGFISERLINLYVYHNSLKIKGIPSYKIIDL
ncbi:DUF4422 domain-containing protein [Flavobacterium succinicans]|uniref:DUF4422 domain-containing protein n=1 Tax=Flavobacterium succinicans TaxID=29536 RepID=A0A199XRU4_9FLAO|nr:DUF4422 domain-containing protein [Flavobacterium succinicans]OAZ04355.1 hypothetical protein FLB_13500 [Flavobacterium succinicans]